MRRRLVCAVLLVLLGAAAGDCGQRPLRVAAVQLEISSGTYASLASFRAAVSAPVRRAVREFQPDLIIFPEYTCALLALRPYAWAMRGDPGSAACFQRIRAVRPGLKDVRALFLEQAAQVDRTVRAIFGGLARESRATIVAGSYFSAQQGAGGRAELRNRACVFDPDGELVYTQDKVFLTEYEQGLGLSPGRIEDATVFRTVRDHGRGLGGVLTALTICRDTFHPEWESAFRKAGMWIDIKANGTTFSPQEEQGFREALPARLPGSGVPYGVTVCLVGKFLDLLWEGRSSFLRLGEKGVETMRESVTATGGDVLFAEIPY